MSATRQGKSSAEIDQIVARRVTDAIEAIGIYETKIRMTHDPVNQVMAAPVIYISSDTSEESVGSHAPRVILFGAIPAIIPIIPEWIYSHFSDSDPLEDSLPPAPYLPLVSPFLCSDDSEADGESEPAEQRPVSSSHDTLAPLSEFPLAPVVAPPRIRRRPAILVQPGEAIPFGRLYRTHLNRPRKLLTARKRVRHIPAHRLAMEDDTPMLIHYTTEDFFTIHFDRIYVVVRLLVHWRPSRKRCRSPTTSVPLPTHVSRLIAPTPADLLPPRKRFRDSYSPEDSREEHIEVDTADAEAIADVGISEGVVAHPEDGVGMGFEIAASDVREDDEEFEAEASAADTREIVVDPLAIGDSSESSRGETVVDVGISEGVVAHLEDSLGKRFGSLRLEYLKVRAMLSIERDRIDSIRWYMALSQEEFRQVRRDRDDTRRRLRRTMTITRSDMTPEAIKELINRRVEEVLAAYEETRAANALEAKNQSQNSSDGGNGHDGNRDGENGNGENGNGGNGNPNENVFHISNCPEKSQVKYATCTLLNSVLTWWNSHKRAIGTEDAFAMSWRELMKLMTKMVPKEEDGVEKFIRGLPDNIQGNVIAAEPTKLQDAVRISNNLMDQKLKGYAMKNAENKRRLDYTAGNDEKKPYNGLLPLCNKCKLHHEGLCTVRCGKCNKVGHLTQDCKDRNRRNKAGNKNGVDRSFISTTFSTLLDITPDTLDVSYAVELIDERISKTNTVLRGCALELLGHPFNIDLMPVELGSFDAIIGMDWLANHHAVIVCDEKVVQIPYRDKVLIVQGDRDSRREKSKLSIISCAKTHKYVERGSLIFLAQVTKKEIKNVSEEKRLEDMPTVQDFPEVFPEDLPGLPPMR
ncbi:putative reverse transcriptase domain-containing protein [Tanacetum coccineum]